MNLLDRRRLMMARNAQTDTEYIFDSTKNYSLYSTRNVNGKACQGGCVVGDKWYALTITEDNSTQYLYCYDMTAKTFALLGTYTTLYHANSMTYNPNTDEFYVATGYAEYGYAVLDGSDYSQKASIVARDLSGTAFVPWNVAYDRNRNLVYCHVGATLYVNSTDGTCIAERTLEGYVTHTTGQGIETDGKYIYISWSDYIDIYTVGGKFVKSVVFQSAETSSYKELEEIGYDWNGRFYCHEFNGSNGYNVNISAMLIRSFGGWVDMAYVPLSAGTFRATNATVVYNAIDAVTITSAGAKSYNMYTIGAGYPFGYSYLEGKQCRVSFDLTRNSGADGNFNNNVFTCSANKITTLGSRLFQKSRSFGTELPVGETIHVEYNFVWGEGDYAPASDKQGTYIGYCLFLYADNGVGFTASNYKFEVRV